jgi:hypothetical protein
MTIQSLNIRNTMGVRDVNITLDAPILLVSGPNGAGKSSLIEAIRLALGEDPERVRLKKEYDSLVTEGAKNGRITAVVDDAEFGMTLPSGKAYGPTNGLSPFLPYVIDTRRFAKLEADQRRSLLFDLTGRKVNGAFVRDMLKRREISDTLIEQVLPELGRGFPAAEAWAKDQAKQAKADWRAITGETWGSQKGEAWVADTPEPFDSVRMRHVAALLDERRDQVRIANQDIGVLKEKAKAHDAWVARKQTAEKVPGRVAELQRKLEFDQAELAKWQQQVDELQQKSGTGPREGLVHDLAACLADAYESASFDAELDQRIDSLIDTYEAQYGALDAQGDPEAAAALPAAIRSRDLFQRSVENDQRDLQVAKPADPGPEPEKVDAAELERQTARAADLDAELRGFEEERRRLDRLALLGQQAEANTKKAGAMHESILAWLKLAEALAPDGIPGEILGTALKPFNDALRQSAEQTGWMQAAIGADMTITAGGRPYNLISESEQWRTDAMLAEAISRLANIGLLILDRADVLQPSDRPTLIGWLESLAVIKAIQTAIVAITLKSRPTGMPDTVQTVWIEDGRIVSADQPLAEAA